ncbi:hypothetical protein ACK3TF_002313 [Chlorella vulgaris]
MARAALVQTWRSVAPQRTSLRRRALLVVRSQGEPAQQQQQQDEPPSSSSTFLVTATVGNAAMALAGAGLGNWNGMDVSHQLLGSLPNLPAALACTLPLAAVCYYAVNSNDPRFAEIEALLKKTLLPQLQALPAWGVCLLALGAGVGEETLFRGFLQSYAVDGIQAAAPNLTPAAVTGAGIAATSLVFGALHALTPTYFWFATVGSVLFGLEYLATDLPTAVTTHWLYDWGALAYTLNAWSSEAGAGDSGGGGSNSVDA